MNRGPRAFPPPCTRRESFISEHEMPQTEGAMLSEILAAARAMGAPDDHVKRLGFAFYRDSCHHGVHIVSIRAMDAS